MNACSASQPQAIGLLKRKEMSLKEATVLTGMSVGALRVVTLRALQRLRKILPLRSGDTLRPKCAKVNDSLGLAALRRQCPLLFQDLDLKVMIVMWSLGTAALFVGLRGPFRREMFQAGSDDRHPA